MCKNEWNCFFLFCTLFLWHLLFLSPLLCNIFPFSFVLKKPSIPVTTKLLNYYGFEIYTWLSDTISSLFKVSMWSDVSYCTSPFIYYQFWSNIKKKIAQLILPFCSCIPVQNFINFIFLYFCESIFDIQIYFIVFYSFRNASVTLIFILQNTKEK